ncbi:aldehyde dehydrogenase family protein [Gottfriedia sp. NPDC057991]|uniref:aldehyde dehydrogenase family protein n=1 Tax=Gottfriedia sp. NPDC057991 TaxID=3346298 RepID=UPI0036DC7E12
MLSYKHEPFTDFSKEENKNAFKQALDFVNSQLEQEFPITIGSEKITTDQKIVSYNPAKKEEVVGIVSKANKELAEKAMQEALKAFNFWKEITPSNRAKQMILNIC